MADLSTQPIPDAAQALMSTIAEQATLPASARGRFRICGAGSKDLCGDRPLVGEPLSTRDLSGITSYEPSELVITALGGTPLAVVEAALAAQGQCLAFEPPRFAGHPSIGGVVASGLSGPSRASAGAVRDFMLGVQIINGQGQWLKFGGQVMKNVAGYDVSRLMAGSWGALGVIAEVSLKVLPLPRAQATLRFEMGQSAAIEQLNRWGGQPLPLNASSWQLVDGKGVLAVRLSGAEAAVASACTSLGGERAHESAEFWAGWRDQTDAFFRSPSDSHALWRLSVPQTAPVVDLGGAAQAIEWHGGQRWAWLDAVQSDGLQQRAEVLGGGASIFIASKSMNTVTKGQYATKKPAKAAAQALQRRLQAQFDPHGVLDASRLLD